jgi:hypothetical protein
MNRRVLYILTATAAAAMASTHADAALTLAADGHSAYTIVVPEKAPASVQAAARELQRDIAQATGAKLPIEKESQAASGPLISLGATRQAKAAGLSIQNIPAEGYRIVTKADDLYILGLDTAALVTTTSNGRPYNNYQPQPDISGPQFTPNGGFSNGTANGVYSFLEDYLNVRWLMPGDLGRDVPPKATFTIEQIDRTDSPQFIYRVLPYTQTTTAVQQWWDHQKLGFSFRLNDGHSWTQTVPADLYKTHPDWFAMIDGKRVPPVGRYKLETTNPRLVEYFADKAIAALKADPHENTYSLSPSDSRGWSQSPQSKALYDPAPPGSEYPSITPLILKWYHDVSAVVARKYPEGKLAGFIYSDYLFPPTKGAMTLPDNFTPVIAPSFDYGYTLYRPQTRQLFDQVMGGWAKVAPPTWFYYDLPNQLTLNSGMLTPPGIDILNFVFPRLVKYHIKGGKIYGVGAWSQAALVNYITARLFWNPRLDAANLQKEWLRRAYGPQAAAVMEQLYQKLEAGFADYYRAHSSARYMPDEAMFKNLFGAQYPELERLFLEAANQPMTDAQRRRLGLIQENMIVLQWRLRNAGDLPKNFTSPLQRTDKQVVDLMLAPHKDFNHFWNILSPRWSPPLVPVKVRFAPPGAAPGDASIPNAGRILLYSTKEAPVQITARNVHPGPSFLTYVIDEVTDQSKRQIQSGILYDGLAITFNARPHTAYYLYIQPNGLRPPPQVAWELSIPNAAPAQAAFQAGAIHLQGPASPLSVYVPKRMHVSTQSEPAGLLLRTGKQSIDRTGIPDE